MHDLSEVTLPPSPSSRRFWLGVGFLVLIVLAAVYGLLYFAAGKRLQEALRETDQLDPGWRLEEILAQRPPISDEDNSAVQTMTVHKLLPPRWPAWEYANSTPTRPRAAEEENRLEELKESFRDLGPPDRLSEAQLQALRDELQRAAPAVAEARKLATLPRGRHPLVYKKEDLSILLTTVQVPRQSVHLLHYDALLRAAEGDVEGALLSATAALNAGRSLGDEPMFIPQLVRLACRAIAIRSIERALAQGQTPGVKLAALQRVLEEEEAEPLLLIALRGERADVDGMLEAVQRGEIKMEYLWPLALEGLSPNVPWETVQLYVPGAVKNSRAAYLRYVNQLVEIARLPVEQQAVRIQEVEALLPKQPLIVRVLGPTMGKVARATRRGHADLRCAATALAVEQYRLEHGRWPETLTALGPTYLRAVPVDPFDGAPLRFRHDKEGVVVYSVGPDDQDDGGDFETLNTHKQGTDLGFRLWEVERRQQPPAAPIGKKAP